MSACINVLFIFLLEFFHTVAPDRADVATIWLEAQTAVTNVF